MKSFRSAVKRGLTLIELVVVMAILVALAAIVIPRLDFLAGQAGFATAATNAGELYSMLQTYKASSGNYPSNLDLLINGSGQAFSSVYSGGGLPITAFTASGPPADAYYRSMLEGGLNVNAVQMTGSTSNASYAGGSGSSTSSANVINLVNDGGFGSPLSTLANTGYYAPAIFTTLFPAGASIGTDYYATSSTDTTPTTSTASGIYLSTGAPYTQGTAGQVPTGTQLLVLGIGPSSSMVGNVMASAPLETDTDDPTATYCRYMAIFQIYSSGKPAQLKMVVDHRFRQIQADIDRYNAGGPTGTTAAGS